MVQEVATTRVENDGEIQQVSRLPKDLAVLKMENDNIISLAATHPRDHKAILSEITDQLQTYKSFAQEAIYCKPVGKDDKGKMKYARGLSIRMAEALAAAYKYNRIDTDVEVLDPNTVKVTAKFMDYQNGRIWTDSGICSKKYKTKRGQVFTHSDDRFYNVVVKAEASRRLREVILRSVPPGLKKEAELIAEKELDQFLDESTAQKIIANFAAKGVTVEMLESHLNRAKEDWRTEDRRTLIGVWNMLEQDESTVKEIFGDPEETASEAAATKAADDINNKIKDAAKQPEPKHADDPKDDEAPVSAKQINSAIDSISKFKGPREAIAKAVLGAERATETMSTEKLLSAKDALDRISDALANGAERPSNPKAWAEFIKEVLN